MSITSTPQTEPPAPPSRLAFTPALLLFSLTLFASATLLFLVQPLIGKLILPFFGGTPAVWATCMVFFQAVLLAGYSYAHLLASRFEPRQQALIHLVVVLLPLVAFYLAPVGAAEGIAPSTQVGPALGVILILVQLIAVPFFVLSTMAPLLQRWFGVTADPAARDPYFLYAASNLGSMLALLSFPFLLEPNLRLPALGSIWMVGYGVLALLTAACAGLIIRGTKQTAEAAPAEAPPGEAPSFRARCRWVLLAFVPSSLMLGVTTYMTTDIAAVPLLWILPLTLYLLSFILVFSRSTAKLIDLMILVFPVAVLLVVFLMITDLRPSEQWGWRFVVNLSALFVVAMVCHGELAKARPATAFLTGYYLCLSLGGVLGGAFNSLLAPLLFNSVAEYPLVLTIACLCATPLLADTDEEWTGGGLIAVLGLGGLYFLYLLLSRDVNLAAHAYGWKSQPLAWLLLLGLVALLIRHVAQGHDRERRERWLDIGLPLALGVIALGMIVLAPFYKMEFSDIITWLGVAPDDRPAVRQKIALLLTYIPLVALCYGLAGRPVRFSLGVGALLAASALSLNPADTLHQERSFFAVHKVEFWHNLHDKSFGHFHALTHGTTIHGLQRSPRDPALQRATRSGIATLLAAADPWQAAVSSVAVAETLRDVRNEPMAYFHRSGPIGDLFKALRQRARPPKQIAVLGLGTGTLAGYLLPGQHATIYEIDDVAVRIAQDPRYFTYLRDTRGSYDIIMGDGRLKLGEAPDGYYDLLFMDAFSSDSIPVHLVTREAIQLYFRKLKPDGILVVNVANRYLDPTPVLANIAQDLGLVGLEQHDEVREKRITAMEIMVSKGHDPEWVASQEGYVPGKFSSSWVILARDRRDFGALVQSSSPWQTLTPDPDKGIWTDDYSNLFQILK